MIWFDPEAIGRKLRWKPNYNPVLFARGAVRQHPARHGTVFGMAFNDAYVISEATVRAAYLNGVWYTRKGLGSIVVGEVRAVYKIQFVEVDTEEQLLAIARGSTAYAAYKLGVRP